MCAAANSRAAKQRPPEGGLVSNGVLAASEEFVVQAHAHDVILQPAGSDIRAGHHRRNRSVAEVDVEILKLGAPVIQERIFQAAADGPAAIGIGGTERSDTGYDAAEVAVSIGPAARDIRQPAIECVAEAAAH